MKNIQEYEKDISSIKSIMERSVKFISLSGLSGVLSGIYAIVGAIAAYFLVHYPISPFRYRIYSIQDESIIWKLIFIAAAVLIASITTGFWLTQKKARKNNTTVWSKTSKRLLTDLAIPLVTGGVLILIILYNGHFGLAAPLSLIFYGLALVHASSSTYDEIRYLGFSEIVIGIISTMLPGYGLVFWALGFGVLHIVYGTIMYTKYDK